MNIYHKSLDTHIKNNDISNISRMIDFDQFNKKTLNIILRKSFKYNNYILVEKILKKDKKIKKSILMTIDDTKYQFLSLFKRYHINLYFNNNFLVRKALDNGYINVLKFFIKDGKIDTLRLIYDSENYNFLLLLKNNKFLHIEDDLILRQACLDGNFNLVKFLLTLDDIKNFKLSECVLLLATMDNTVILNYILKFNPIFDIQRYIELSNTYSSKNLLILNNHMKNKIDKINLIL